MIPVQRRDYEALADIFGYAARVFRQLADRPLVSTPETMSVLETRSAVLTVNEAAEELRMSRATLYPLLMSGELASFKIGSSRRVLRCALNEWLDAQR